MILNCNDVSIHIQGDEKEALTVLATISASDVKWPLYLLAKEKTAPVAIGALTMTSDG
jgi:hypothetical protein